MLNIKEYEKYNKTFKKYGVSLVEMASMQSEIEKGNYKITLRTEYYNRKNGKWDKIPYEVEQKEIDVPFYLNCISSITIFEDRVRYGNTRFGKIPCALLCYSWGTGDTKCIRTFKFN